MSPREHVERRLRDLKCTHSDLESERRQLVAHAQALDQRFRQVESAIHQVREQLQQLEQQLAAQPAPAPEKNPLIERALIAID